MSAAAVICVRQDDAYFESCLKQLIAHGVDYAILDNGMGPEARALLDRPSYRERLRELWPLPFAGAFELERQIEAKERMFETLDTDWLVHLDVDEAMHACVEGERLIDSLARVDVAGFNAVNFDEFVFLPLDAAYAPGAAVQPICAYYFFEPSPGPRLVRARKKGAGLSMTAPNGQGAGHQLFGNDLRLAPENFVLRHYIVGDQEHARRKYTARVFAERELARGWHGNRTGHAPEAFTFPPLRMLKRLPEPASRAFDRSDPKRTHYWQWPRPDRAETPEPLAAIPAAAEIKPGVGAPH
jgi:hypothetical protein